MREKPFRLAILVGRFQVIHLGHVEMAEKALGCAQRVAVLIGSAQESGTEKNPLSYEERADCLRAVFGERVELYPLPDAGIGNNPRWGAYVLEAAARLCGEAPDLAVSGQEERRQSWYEGLPVAELTVPKTIPISASQLRLWLERDERENWAAYTPPALHPRYPQLREAVHRAAGHRETASV